MTETTTTAIATDVVDTYLAAYNETDVTVRDALLEQAFAPEGRLVDPPLEGIGREGISEMMGIVHQQFPGHTFRRSSGVDEHHDHLRYGWELLAPDGAVALSGMDVAVVRADGKLTRIAGFFGDLPARDA